MPTDSFAYFGSMAVGYAAEPAADGTVVGFAAVVVDVGDGVGAVAVGLVPVGRQRVRNCAGGRIWRTAALACRNAFQFFPPSVPPARGRAAGWACMSAPPTQVGRFFKPSIKASEPYVRSTDNRGAWPGARAVPDRVAIVRGSKPLSQRDLLRRTVSTSAESALEAVMDWVRLRLR